ncbi:MAG: hypothetical protein ACP5HZ_02375 [Ferrimicrobium sp.]|uniref:hypothetical protein n=1 Tax=Ferrimicrobium sp. TaxID=2926050 RepID=UPI00261DFBCB|nr:hypothetical protein [Ferrimicrobium sp.]
MSRTVPTAQSEKSGWGFVGLIALAPLLCCGGPLLVGTLGVLGAAWIGGIGLGLVALGVFVAWRLRRAHLLRSHHQQGFGSFGCCDSPTDGAAIK